MENYTLTSYRKLFNQIVKIDDFKNIYFVCFAKIIVN